MELQFSFNTSDKRKLFKELTDVYNIQGTLKDSSSIINPIILVEKNVFRYNYCFIPEWNRYYSIRNIESYRNNMYIVYMECDVLMSFKNDIINLQVVIDKQTEASNSDEYIDDGSLKCDNYSFNRVLNFPNGFNNNPTHILITAG